MSQRFELNKELIEYAYENLNHIPKGNKDYELMISGNRYNCMNEQLLMDRLVRHEMAQDYGNLRMGSQSPEEYFQTRNEHLKKIFGKIKGDRGAYIEAPFQVDYGYNIELGKDFYANFNMTILDCSLVKIGDGVQFGPNVVLSCATHPVDSKERCVDFIEWAREIIIGDRVWLGANVTVLPGVTIGAGTTVGANSVVSRILPAYCVAVGTPARVVKKLPGFQE